MNILTAEFWKERVNAALARSELHRVLYDVEPEQWDSIQEDHRRILARVIDPTHRTRLLDVGCNYGSLIPLLPPTPIEYWGIGFSPDLLTMARQDYPSLADHFVELNPRHLPLRSRTYDLAVCRSIDGTIKEQLGFGVWREIEAQILKVADRLLLLNYSDPGLYRLTDAIADPAEFRYNRLEVEGGYLIYRPGQDGTCEIYDLFVEEDKRRQGIGSHLVQSLIAETVGTVFGFTRASYGEAQAFYQSQEFRMIPVPGMYRGDDGIMFWKQRMPGGA